MEIIKYNQIVQKNGLNEQNIIERWCFFAFFFKFLLTIRFKALQFNQKSKKSLFKILCETDSKKAETERGHEVTKSTILWYQRSD